MDQSDNVSTDQDRRTDEKSEDSQVSPAFREYLQPVLREIDEELADTDENPREHVFSDEDNS